MIRQKTINSFQEGMITDSSPLTASNKSLTNCLNGTFITNDGDDGLLLNDMGNTRVENVKLDTGYVPVGMCSYGGVTYVASYNPINNKGLVGSFPSPATLSWSDSKGHSSAISSTTLKKVVKIFDGDEIIRPGDRFVLKSTVFNNSDIQFNPGWGKKNPQYTLSICVMDNTGTLHSISDGKDKREFFSDFTSTETPDWITSVQDKLKYYNSKISGPLYAVLEANVLDSYDFTASFFKGIDDYSKIDPNAPNTPDTIGKDEIGAIFYITYKYNCPKDVIKGLKVNNTLLEAELTQKETYPDIASNLYYLDNIKTGKYKENSGVQTFDIIPNTIYGDLEALKKTINVDFDKLNTGLVTIDAWKYFVEDTGIMLDFTISSYPINGTKISDFTLEFYNLTKKYAESNILPEYIYKLEGRSSYNGIFLRYITFDFLLKRLIYLVKFKYSLNTLSTKLDNSTDDTKLDNSTILGYKILITTPIYNNLYLESTNFDSETVRDNNIINYTLDYNIKESGKHEIVVPDVILNDNADLNKQYSIENNINKKYIIEPTFNLEYINRFPFDVEDITYIYTDNSVTSKIDSSNIKTTEDINIAEDPYINQTEVTSSGNTLTIDTNVSLLFKGKETKKELLYDKVFDTYFPKSNDRSDSNMQKFTKFFGIPASTTSNLYPKYTYTTGITVYQTSGHDDHHYVKLMELNLDNIDASYYARDLHSTVFGDYYDGNKIVFRKKDGKVNFYLEDILKNLEVYKFFTTPFVFLTYVDYDERVLSYREDSNKDIKDSQFYFKNMLDYTAASNDDADDKLSPTKNSTDYVTTIQALLIHSILLWKYNNNFIKVNPINHFMNEPEPLSFLSGFLELVSNIYSLQNESKVLNKYIPSSSEYIYLGNASIEIDFNFDIKVTGTLKIDETELMTTESKKGLLEDNLGRIIQNFNVDNKDQDLLDSLLFKIKTGSESHIEHISIPLTGGEAFLEKLEKLLLGNTNPILIYNNTILERTADGLLLSPSKLYEIHIENGQPLIYLFGEKEEFNKINKKHLYFDGDTIIPINLQSNTESIPICLLSSNNWNANPSNNVRGDSATDIYLNKISCINLK